MAPRLWFGVLLVVALSWLEREMRPTTLDWLGLHTTLALACGIGAVILKALQPGRARRTGVTFLLLVCLTIAIVWQYFQERPGFSWPDAIVGALGLVVLPGITAAVYGNWKGGATWTFVQVTSLAIVAAPVSMMFTYFLALLILRE